jgi:hypothetical protein
MDTTKYLNNLKYPRKTDFRTTFSCTAPSGRVHQVVDYDNDAYQKACLHYWEEEKQVAKLFRDDLFEHLGIEGHPKADLLFSKAYEHGHSGGYSEIVSWAEDLLELIL